MTDGNRYSLDVVGGKRLVLNKVVGGNTTKLASAAYAFNSWSWYTLSVYWINGSITAYGNGTPIMQVNDSTLTSGAVGLEANDPVSFNNVVVTQLAPSSPPPVPPPPPPQP